jgi:hypothetical protein
MTPEKAEKADRSVKFTDSQCEFLAGMNKSSMSAAFDEAIYGTQPTSSFIMASASNKESMTGIPTTAIADVDTPSLSMWTTMQKRLITADHYMQEEAAQDDVFMILSNIRNACTIGMWKLTAKDIEASAETIKNIYNWIDETGLIKAFTGGAVNGADQGALYNYQVHGKCAIFVWRGNKAGGGNKITKFANLPVNGLRRFTHPRNPTIYYFHQKFLKESDYTDPSKWEDVNSVSDEGDVSSETQSVWYIEGGESNRELKDKETGKLMYPNIQPDDWVNKLEDIVYLENPSPPLNDNIVTTIMNKRYMVRMSIVAVQLGIIPIYKLQFGTDDPKLFPPSVDERLKTVNKTEYDRQAAIVAKWKTNMETMVNNVDTSIRNGKPIAFQYGVTVERDEPQMALTAEFMETIISIYNNIIARAVRLPLSLIESSGTELATSMVVKSVVDIMQQAEQLGFYDTLMYLIKLQFAKEIEAEGIRIVLQNLDKSNIKTLSEIRHLDAQAIYALYRAGATPETLSDFANESEGIPIQNADMSAVHNERGGDTDVLDEVEE